MFSLAVLVLHGLHVVAAVEVLQVEIPGRFRRPETEGVDEVVSVSRHGVVIGHGQYLVGLDPRRPRAAVGAAVGLDMTVEADGVEELRPGEFPEIAVPEPVVRRLGLAALLDPLGEDAVFVPYAVPVAGVPEGRHGIEKAGGKPSKAAVAEGGVPLVLQHVLQGDVEDAHGLAVLLDKAEIDEV